jgi:hypothetical protein
MTRSHKQRNQNPAALLKDRHSRTDRAKTELNHKDGGGAHNWGSLSREEQYESEARADADKERDEGVFDMENENEQVAPLPQRKASGDVDANGNANSGAAFEAVSPTDSMSSLDSAASAPKGLQAVGRRLSNVSDEERDKARQYREGVRASGGESSRRRRCCAELTQQALRASPTLPRRLLVCRRRRTATALARRPPSSRPPPLRKCRREGRG